MDKPQDKHLAHLLVEDRDRYSEKLTVGGEKLPDPLTIEEKLWREDVSKWPAIQYGDIWNYLVNTPGKYTAESMKAYKSLDGYNFFVSGHVGNILFYDASDSVCFLKSSVIPSQKITDKKQWHMTWLCVDKTGAYVISAHCSCKAGLGEACSHVAALLFKVEAAKKLDLIHPSKTSASCVWNRYYREKVNPAPIKDIDFSNPKHGQKKKMKINTDPVVDQNSDEEESALRALKRICPEACVLTKADSDTDTASDDDEMPPVLSREHVLPKGLDSDGLEAQCNALLKDFSVTETQASNLEKMTRSQAESSLWKRQRVGRITSSIVHDIKSLKDSTDRKGCLQKVLRETVNISALPSVRYGIANERRAKAEYARVVSKEHDKFSLRDCGLVIDTTFPLFAASPDGIRYCDCHGEGLVEVKCSFKHRHQYVCDIPDIDGQFYLEPKTLNLKCTHRYYTQVQFQMYVCNKQYCDFVVFTDKGIFTQTIYYNPDFVHELLDKCLSFANDHLLPNILSRKLDDHTDNGHSNPK